MQHKRSSSSPTSTSSTSVLLSTESASFQYAVIGFVAGVFLPILIYLVCPVAEWRLMQVMKAYVILHWTHTRETWYLQELSNVLQLPFTFANGDEQLVVRTMISGMLGAAIPVVAGRLTGLPHPVSLPAPRARPGHRKRLPINDSSEGV